MLYVVVLNLNPGLGVENVRQRLGAAHSWYRFHPTAWILCTDQTTDFWSQRLRPLVQPHGSAFICQLDLNNRQGWQNPAFWDWMNEHMFD